MTGTSPTLDSVTTDDGVRLYCEVWGSGANTLIVPNGICYMDEFRRFAQGRTVVAYDVRNRGRSDTLTDPAKLERGILNDVDDLDAVRRHFGAERIDLIGHSYIGVMVVLYAMHYPRHVSRLVQIGPAPPHADTRYPAHLAWADATMEEFIRKSTELRQQMTAQDDPVEICRKFWELLRVLSVFDAKDAAKIDWIRCELPNERSFMMYWIQRIVPSLQKLRFTAEDFAKVTAPVLTVHGNRDRNAPYGGGREWAMHLPDARLLTVPDTAHAPWVEAPEKVLEPIEAFFDGRWPELAEKVTALDPQAA